MVVMNTTALPCIDVVDLRNEYTQCKSLKICWHIPLILLTHVICAIHSFLARLVYQNFDSYSFRIPCGNDCSHQNIVSFCSYRYKESHLNPFIAYNFFYPLYRQLPQGLGSSWCSVTQSYAERAFIQRGHSSGEHSACLDGWEIHEFTPNWDLYMSIIAWYFSAIWWWEMTLWWPEVSLVWFANAVGPPGLFIDVNTHIHSSTGIYMALWHSSIIYNQASQALLFQQVLPWLGYRGSMVSNMLDHSKSQVS